jgi:hypothetical protein
MCNRISGGKYTRGGGSYIIPRGAESVPPVSGNCTRRAWESSPRGGGEISRKLGGTVPAEGR